jgi:hypothetical protein
MHKVREAWRGEERLWRVFWVYGVPCRPGSLGLHRSRLGFFIIIAGSRFRNATGSG